jgi:cobalamin synthase
MTWVTHSGRAVAKRFPDYVLEDRTLAFFQVYIVTFPWTLAVTVITVVALRDLVPEKWALIAVIGILVASQTLGTFLLDASSGEQLPEGLRLALQRIRVPPFLVPLYVVALIVFGYAVLYGIPLFLAGLAVGIYCGWIIHTKLWDRIAKLWIGSKP